MPRARQRSQTHSQKLLIGLMLTGSAVGVTTGSALTDEIIVDYIGDDSGESVSVSIMASQYFEEAYSAYDVGIAQPFDLDIAGTMSSVEAVIGGWNGYAGPEGITGYQINFYGSDAAVCSDLVGDLSFQEGPGSISDTWAGEGSLIAFATSVSLDAGSYFVSVIGYNEFASNGQCGVHQSLRSGSVALQSNPNGGFSFECDDPDTPGAYRITGAIGSINCVCSSLYEVGDRVHAVVDNPQGASGILAGHCGTVLCGRNAGDDLNLLIEWDDWSNGHDNTGSCECGDGESSGTSSCWWVDCPDIVAGCGGDCDTGFVCGNPVPWCNDEEDCFCGNGYDGLVYCVARGNCSSYLSCEDGSCPAGFYCIVDTCCSTPICISLCGEEPPVIGACCYGQECVVTDQADCESSGGTWLGSGTTCGGFPCGSGGCCHGESCSEQTEDDCASSGGTWLGDDTTCEGFPCDEGGDIATIQALVDAASDGDTIDLSSYPGVWSGETLFINKPLTIRAGVPDDGVPRVIFDGQGNGPVIYVSANFSPSDDPTFVMAFEGIEIRGGINSDQTIPTGIGGGIRVWTGSPYSGRVFSLQMTDCVVANCSAYIGGGVGLYRIGNVPVAMDVSLTRCAFTDNHADSSGAALYVLQTREVELWDCEVIGNSGSDAVYLTDGPGANWTSTAVVKQSKFHENEKAGLSQSFLDHLYVGSSALTANGKGIVAQGPETRIHHCTIAYNRDVSVLGGIGVQGWEVSSGTPSLIVVRNSVIWGNMNQEGATADAQLGGASGYDFFAEFDVGDDAYTTNVIQGWDLPGTYSWDPMFRDPMGPDGELGGDDADLRPLPGSPVVDAADTYLTFAGWAWPETGRPQTDFLEHADVDHRTNLGDGPFVVGGPGFPWDPDGGYDLWSDSGALGYPDESGGTEYLVWSGDSSTDWSNPGNWLWYPHAPDTSDYAVLGPVPDGSGVPVLNSSSSIHGLLVTGDLWSPTFNSTLTLTKNRGLRIGGYDSPLHDDAILWLSGGGGAAVDLRVEQSSEVNGFGGGLLAINSGAVMEIGGPLRLTNGGRLTLIEGGELRGIEDGAAVYNHGGTIFPQGTFPLGSSSAPVDLEMTGLVGDDTVVAGTLDASFYGSVADSLSVSGDMALGGTLNLVVKAGIPEGIFPILSCQGNATGNLTVRATGLSGDQFFRIYSTTGSTAGGGTTYWAEVVSASDLMGLDGADSETITATPNDIALADMNDDGHLDLLMTIGGADDRLYIIFNSGGDTDGDGVWDGFDFTSQISIPVGDEPMGIGIGESVDSVPGGENLLEVAVAIRGQDPGEFNNDEAVVMLEFVSDGSGSLNHTLSSVQLQCLDEDCTLPPDPVDVAFWDIDEDGSDEIVASSFSDSSYRVIQWDSSPLTALVEVEGITVSDPPWDVDPIEDEDTKDGSLRRDHAGGTSPMGGSQIVLNRGPIDDPFALTSLVFPLNGAPDAIAFGDLDDNGYGDGVVVMADTNTLQIVLRDDEGRWTNGAATAWTSETVQLADITDVTIGDFDDDGDNDLAMIIIGSGSQPSRVTRILRNELYSPAGDSDFVSFTDLGETLGGDGASTLIIGGEVDGSPGDDVVIITDGGGLLSGLPTVEPQVSGTVVYDTVEGLINAIENAQAGDVIQVAAGIYELQSRLTPSVAITLIGAIDEDGNPATRISVTDDIRIMSLVGAALAGSEFRNIHFDGDGWSRAAWIDDVSGQGISYTNCLFKSCHYGYSGAALSISASVVTIEDSRFEDCFAKTTDGVAYNGGGIFLATSTLSVSRCTFDLCRADNVGGAIMSVSDSIMDLSDCVFQSCQAIDGGAIRSENGTTLTAMNCTFGAGIGEPMDGTLSNVATRDGGAIKAYAADVDLIDCLFRDNSCGRRGGGIICRDGTDLFMVDCLFEANQVTGYNEETRRGGGAYFHDLATLTGSGNTFIGNEAQEGGGVRITSSGSESTPMSLDDWRLQGNESERGGGLYTGTSVVRLSGCELTQNEASSSGGGIYNGSSTVRIQTSQICSNTPSGSGDGDQISGSWEDLGGNCITMFCDGDGDGTDDCIDGCPDDPDKTEPGDCGCGVSDTDSDSDGTPDCIDGCPADPDKTEPGECGCGVSDTDSDSDGTPDCIDGCPDDPDKTEPGDCGCGVSDNDSDSDGTPDCVDGCPDDPDKTEPGVCGCGVSDADSDGDGIPDCNDDYPDGPNPGVPGSLQQAIRDAADGDTITLGQGTYIALETESAVFSVDGMSLAIRGVTGESGDSLTVIDGEGLRRCGLVVNAAEFVLQNVQLINGGMPGDGGVTGGGGLLAIQSDVTLRGCVFLDCQLPHELPSDPSGGGASLILCDAEIEACRFESCTAAYGGGLCLLQSPSTVVDCQFVRNTSFVGGGTEVRGVGGTPVSFIRCSWLLNQARSLDESYGEGGGLVAQQASMTLLLCEFNANFSALIGGGVAVSASEVECQETVFTDNIAEVGPCVAVHDSLWRMGASIVCGSSLTPIDGDWVDLGDNCITEVCDGNGNGEIDCLEAPCPGDLSGDGVVGIRDLLLVLDGWESGDGDADGDGDVDSKDLLFVIENWGPC